MSESFPYRAKPGKMLFPALFFSACGIVFGYEVATNDRGLIINGVIELSSKGATIFYGVLGALSLLLVLSSVFATIYGHLKGTYLILDEDHLLVPCGLFQRRLKRVEFRHITSTALQTIYGQQFFKLHTLEGKVTITRSLLTPDSAFERIMAMVHARMPQAHEKVR